MVKSLHKSDGTLISSGKWLGTLFLRVMLMSTAGLAALALCVAASLNANPEQGLQAAFHQEFVLGDLKGAMERYQAIAAGPTNKRVAANALYRYARCLEKLERRTESHQAYARVARDYSETPEGALARARIEDWEYSVSGPTNLRFEQGVLGKLPDAWFVPALPKDVDRWAQLRRTGCMDHKSCAVVMVPDNSPVRVGNLMQSFNASAYRGKTVHMTAWLRLESSGPEDRAQMWLAVERAGDKKGFFDDMSDRPTRSSEWTRSEITAHIDADATSVKFGVMAIGSGRVWVDRVAFEVVSEHEVPPTGRLKQ